MGKRVRNIFLYLYRRTVSQTRKDYSRYKKEFNKIKNGWRKRIIASASEAPHNSLICALFILNVFVLYFWIVATHGLCLNDLLFFNPTDFFADLFMDFINPIRNLFMNNPYTQIDAIYPPINFLLFSIFGGWIPREYIYTDLTSYFNLNVEYFTLLEGRNNNQGIWACLLFILVMVAVTMSLVSVLLKKHTNKPMLPLALSFMLSYPFLYAIQRGNIVLLSLVFLLIFHYMYDSKNIIVQELSLLFLSILICMKIYPVFLLLYLLFDRQLSKCIRCIFYCGILFFVPFVFYGGWESVIAWIMMIFKTSDKIMEYYPGSNFSFLNMSYLVPIVLQNKSSILAAMNTIFSILFLFLGCLCSFYVRKRWKNLLLITVLFLYFPSSTSTVYNGIFYLAPLIAFIISKNNEKTRFDYIYIALIFLCFINIPYVVYDKINLNKYDGSNITVSLLSLNFSSFAMYLLLTAEGMYNMINQLIRKKCKSGRNITSMYCDLLGGKRAFNLCDFYRNKKSFWLSSLSNSLLLILMSLILAFACTLYKLSPFENMSYYYILNFSALFPFFVAFPMLNKSAIDHENYKDYEVCIASQSVYGSVLGLFYIVIFIISLVILKFNYTVSFLSLGSLLFSVVSAVVFALVLFMIVNILAKNKKWYKFISCIALVCFTIINISMILNRGMEFSILFKAANPLYYISKNILYGVESVADIDAAILFWGIMFASSFVLLFLYSLKKVNLATSPIKALPSYPSSCDNL